MTQAELIRRKQQGERLNRALNSLREHFAGVIILAHENFPDSNTVRYSAQMGDHMALVYHANYYSTFQTQAALHRDLTNACNPPEDLGGINAS